MSKAPTMYVVQKLYLDGHTEDVDAAWSLQDMQTFVGGDIEVVQTSLSHRVLIVNETGLIEGLPTNRVATALVRPGVLMLHGIRGNALLVKR